MSKQEYLDKLEACLRHYLSREEIDDILRDYAEYFEEGRRQSKSDSEIAAKMGDPEMVAKELIEENLQNKESFASQVRNKTREATEKVKSAASSSAGVWSTLGKVLLALVLLPFAAAGAMLLLAVLFVLAAVLVTLFFVPIITGCMALVCLIATPFAFVFAAPSMGLVCLFFTLIGIGFTLATFGLLILLLKAVFGTTRRLLGRRKNRCPDFTQQEQEGNNHE